MNGNQKFLLGTLGAAAAGVAVGMLVAPKKGADTRNLIKDKANDLSGNAKDTYEKGIKELATLTERLKEGVLHSLDLAKDKADGLAKTASENGKKAVQNATY
ncbi:hypothetical protein GCM10027275_30010 [Rhabdobacter roseus]|uniref:Gas vesicle protein n=1 Tax=Rhabdobacter roseus TaxID=1655419 RepID=A0A840TTG3_9BACT|nr:YtxH domain-containing protein [Rhabdobacter roseus]MBB5284957.1 gas vesicle protein [Rhabdobacter roseus]